MNTRDQKRLNAYLDGELEGAARAAAEAWLARDADARAELEGLRATRQAVRTAVPETPDTGVEWRKLAAKLENAGTEPGAPGEDKGRTLFPFPLPLGLGAAAAALVAGLLVWLALPGTKNGAGPGPDLSAGLVELLETDLEDSSTIVYIDLESGWTVVWVVEADAGEGPLG